MNSLNSVKSILSKLTDSEKEILVKYLNFYSNSDNKSKTINLLKILLHNNFTSKEIQLKLYEVTNYVAFNKLLNRLKDKIFEITSFDLSIKSNQYSKRNLVNIELRKKLLQADILQLKGLRNNVLPIYNNIIKRSKNFELYDLQSQALISKQRLQSINSKLSLYAKINNEILNADECNLFLKESHKKYNEIINKINNSNNFLVYKEDLVNSIKLLNQYYKKTQSPTIGYFYNTLSAEFHENNSQFEMAKLFLENAKKILVTNESAYTENRYGTVLLNLSNNSIFLGKFNSAILLAIESKKYFKNHPLTLRIVDEILFYAYFYKLDYLNCSIILSNNKSFIDNETLSRKFIYFQSCLHFVMGNFFESLNTLNTYKEIEKDKEGWNINSRILLIMIRIEIQDFESVDLQIQNLSRFIKRISKYKIVFSRQVFILRILTKLIQEDYNFRFVYQKRIKYFKCLNLKAGEFNWQYKSPELVLFTDWFEGKMKE